MLFNSIAFAIFLPIVFILYWVLPHKYRWILLLVASYYFYMSWNPKYIVLIFFITLISYIAGLLMEKAKNKTNKKIILAFTLVSCLSVLFFFKYFNFFSETIVNFLNLFSLKLNPITLQIMLPVGISFYTFQTLSYVIDVYRGLKAEHHFGIYATFISFFPQLVAGPIERTENLLPQIKEEHKFNYEQATYGLKLMAWGFFKKLAIADVLAIYVDMVFNNLSSYEGFAIVIAAFFFAIQIYCDFSGYSDIAIGTAKLLGINLMTNFKSPYFSSSIKEFWNRWHISLSTWFRDYVYIPLGGNRVSKLRHNVNLMITFLVSGLWHGANSTFVVWGGIHGIAQVLQNTFTAKNKDKSKNKIIINFKILIVFIFCVFAWIFFRANALSDITYIFSHMFNGMQNIFTYIKQGFSSLTIGTYEIMKILVCISILAVYDYFSLKMDVINKISKKKKVIRWGIYLFIIWLIIIGMPVNGNSEFIYFQF